MGATPAIEASTSSGPRPVSHRLYCWLLPPIVAPDQLEKCVFRVVHHVLYLAPVAPFGAMGYIRRSDIWDLGNEAVLTLAFYATCASVISVVLGAVSTLSRFSIVAFVRLMKDALLIVLGMSSWESARAPRTAKLENPGRRSPSWA